MLSLGLIRVDLCGVEISDRSDRIINMSFNLDNR